MYKQIVIRTGKKNKPYKFIGLLQLLLFSLLSFHFLCHCQFGCIGVSYFLYIFHSISECNKKKLCILATISPFSSTMMGLNINYAHVCYSNAEISVSLKLGDCYHTVMTLSVTEFQLPNLYILDFSLFPGF